MSFGFPCRCNHTCVKFAPLNVVRQEIPARPLIRTRRHTIRLAELAELDTRTHRHPPTKDKSAQSLDESVPARLLSTLQLNRCEREQQLCECDGGRDGQGSASRRPASRPSDCGGLRPFRPDAGESAEKDSAPCLHCHEREQQPFWRGSTHAFRDVKCVDCHQVMHKTNSEHQLAVDFRVNHFIYTRPETGMPQVPSR